MADGQRSCYIQRLPNNDSPLLGPSQSPMYVRAEMPSARKTVTRVVVILIKSLSRKLVFFRVLLLL